MNNTVVTRIVKALTVAAVIAGVLLLNCMTVSAGVKDGCKCGCSHSHLHCHRTGECSSCHGNGRCVGCDGSGETNNGSVCSLCGGSGACYVCDGSGSI